MNLNRLKKLDCLTSRSNRTDSWIGEHDAHGRPVFRGERAYRVMYRLRNNDVPTGFHVHHKCENSSCVNVLDKVRAHYEDLKPSRRIDAEVKVLFLGNGSVGKTQLCRRLRGEPFDEKNVSTHGIELRAVVPIDSTNHEI
jgi:Ras of Complex, Roc, domain of DAPkinase